MAVTSERNFFFNLLHSSSGVLVDLFVCAIFLVLPSVLIDDQIVIYCGISVMCLCRRNINYWVKDLSIYYYSSCRRLLLILEIWNCTPKCTYLQCCQLWLFSSVFKFYVKMTLVDQIDKNYSHLKKIREIELLLDKGKKS